VKHIRDNPGVQLSELCDVLPSLSTDQVKTLLRGLKEAGQVYSQGLTRAGRWYAGPAPIANPIPDPIDESND
jgi:hypothetical protein